VHAEYGARAYWFFPTLLWLSSGDAVLALLCSGVTKILSGDPSWAAWDAMTSHYETQPIPAWTSWYAHQMPAAAHDWSIPAMLAVEIVAPFALLLPARFRRTRLLSCLAMMLLQIAIGATGNYGFFNLLTIAVYVAALDDTTLQWLPWIDRGRAPEPARPGPGAWRIAATAAALVLAVLSLGACIREMELTARGSTRVGGTPVGALLRWASPFRAVNGYGLFRVMTTERPEIVIEVSEDGTDWTEYEFRWKAGDPLRQPRFVAPHMPRLDWQMWFAALDPSSAQYWLDALTRRIREGEPLVTRLLGSNPLAGRPRFVRLAYYDYRFTTRAERAATGAWWTRTFIAYLTEPLAATP
jgi:hypothetical protein